MNKAEESFGLLQWPRSLTGPKSGTLSLSHATGIEEYLLYSFYYRLKHAIQNPRLLNNNNNINNNNRTISKSFTKYVSYIPGKHEVKELQKTAILDTAHTLRKVLM